MLNKRPWKATVKSEIVKFLRCEPFNQKFRKLQEENYMKRKFPMFFENFVKPCDVVHFSGNSERYRSIR